MKPPAALTVPKGIEDGVTQSVLLDVRDKLAQLLEYVREYTLTVPGMTDIKAATLKPLLTIPERSLLLAADVVTDVAAVATAISISVIPATTAGTAGSAIAKADRTAASATAWKAKSAKALPLTADNRILEKGESLFLTCTNDGIIASFFGALTFRFRRVD
jgi:hypothetical protein